MERETELTHGNETADGNKKELGNANSELPEQNSCLLRLLIYIIPFFNQFVVWYNAVFPSNASETSEQRSYTHRTRTLGMERQTKPTDRNGTANGNKNGKWQRERRNANSEVQQDNSFLLTNPILATGNGDDTIFSSNASEILRRTNRGLLLGKQVLYQKALLVKRRNKIIKKASSWTLNGSEISEQRISAMNGIMESLTNAGAVITGVYGTENATIVDLVEKVTRRVRRDNLFDKVIRVNVTRKPNLKMIHGEVASALGFTMEEKSEAKRAALLRDRIKMEQKILVVLQDVNEGLDLGKLGIPFGDKHTGCKILLTSMSQEILSNHMHAHRVIEAT